jgi:hypothetical protein
VGNNILAILYYNRRYSYYWQKVLDNPGAVEYVLESSEKELIFAGSGDDCVSS